MGKFGTEIISIQHVGNMVFVLYHDAKTYRFARYDYVHRKLLQDLPLTWLSIDTKVFPCFDDPYHIICKPNGSNRLIRKTLPFEVDR